jgi:hypothetical protein
LVDVGIIASALALAHRLVIALAIEMGADAIDIGKTIHPHPTLGESIGMGGSGTWQLYECAASTQVVRVLLYNAKPELATVRAFC